MIVDRLDQYGVRDTQNYAKRKFKLLASQHCKAAPHPGLYRRHTGLRKNHTRQSPNRTYQSRNVRFIAGDIHRKLRWKLNETVMTLSSRPLLNGLDGWHLSRAQLDVFPEP
jgi:hypothetical protein